MDLLCALGVAVLLTRVGFALYAMGLVRAKNSAGVVMRTITDFCTTVLAFWVVGAAILIQSHNSWLWINKEVLFFGWRTDQPGLPMPYLLFYLAMILTASSVVTGAVAERSRFFPMLIASLILAGFVMPATGQLVWAGWFKRRGFVDLAGACALHVSAGVFAAVAVAFVGPRTGKFNRDGSSSMIPGHNLPLSAIGMLIIMIGWIAYVGGACIRFDTQGRAALYAGPAAMNVVLAIAAAGLATIVMGQLRYGKPDILLTLTGVLGAMVSVCAGGAALPTWSAVVTGAVAGVIVPWAVVVIDLRGRLDDPLGVIAIHGVGGAWGTLAAGFFVPILPTQTRLRLIGIQSLGLVTITLLSALVAVIVFGTLKSTMGLRAKEADEFDGLDLAEHDIGAYPDFQQNTIKSYHLREA
jgi:Amt family ammonium transporter